MKRYLLFVFNTHVYACGGLNDLQSSFDTLEECLKEGNLYDKSYHSFHIFDLKDRIIYNDELEQVVKSDLYKNMFGDTPEKGCL